MKTKHLLLLLFLLPLPLCAQQPGNILHVEIGGGLHTMAFNPGAHAQKKAGGGVGLCAEYRHFFNRKAGIGVGVGFSSHRSSVILTDTEKDTWESYGASVQGRTDFDHWTEQQSVFNVSVPVSFYLQHIINKRWSLIWGIGPQLDIPVNNEYTACDGKATRTVDGEVSVEEAPKTLRRIKSAPVGVSLGTDLGFHFDNQGSLPLYFGLYFNYGLTSFLNESDLPLYADHYAGFFASNRVGAAHLVSLGLKVGFSLNLSKTCSGGRCGFY